MTTAEKIDHMIDILRAYRDGKTIQFSDENHDWRDVDHPEFNFGTFNYRVKPHTFGPQNILPDMWICAKGGNSVFKVIAFNEFSVSTAEGSFSYKNLMDNFEWSTDLKSWQPCGS